MKKVIFYLKPYTFGILFCLIFLTVQGFCELSLPNYMSNIVNVGIQQNGIESSAPEAMSENFYFFLEIFMTDSEKNIFSKNYKFIHKVVAYDLAFFYVTFCVHCLFLLFQKGIVRIYRPPL